MKFLKTLVSLAILPLAVAQDTGRDVTRDLQIGLEGLNEAASNPQLLAQLMHDLQVRGDSVVANAIASIRVSL